MSTHYSTRQKRELLSLQAQVDAQTGTLASLQHEHVLLSRRVRFLELLAQSTQRVESLREGRLLVPLASPDSLQLHRLDAAAANVAKATSSEDFRQRHMDFVKTASLLLQHVNAYRDTCMAAQLGELVHAYHRVTIALLIWNPGALFGAKTQPLAQSDGVLLERTERVMASLDWSGQAEVFELVCLVFSWHLEELERVSQQRAALTTQMEEVISAGGGVGAGTDLVPLLAANLEEFVHVNTLAGVMVAQMMPPQLCAVVHVMMYPFIAVAATCARVVLNQRQETDSPGAAVCGAEAPGASGGQARGCSGSDHGLR